MTDLSYYAADGYGAQRTVLMPATHFKKVSRQITIAVLRILFSHILVTFGNNLFQSLMHARPLPIILVKSVSYFFGELDFIHLAFSDGFVVHHLIVIIVEFLRVSFLISLK
jgi:hypothetical protein